MIESRGLRRSFWKRIRRWLVRYQNDPSCQMSVHGRVLTMPLSHDLPHYMRENPFYDQLLVRLTQFMHRSREFMCSVDIGANIGDSIAALAFHPLDRFVAIEPNPNFFNYLIENCANLQHVLALQLICSSSDEQRAFTIQEKRGTASVVATQGHDSAMECSSPVTLDKILAQHCPEKSIDLLKIDTDGHDFEVLTGARRVIQKDQPVIVFECDIFGNNQYTEQVVDHLDFFCNCGYELFLVYDNTGYLMGCYSLQDTSAFQNLLLYQQTSPFLYFDILIMSTPEIIDFYQEEAEVFVNAIADTDLQPTAHHAVQKVQST